MRPKQWNIFSDQMEEWSAAEANLFEEAIEKYHKDFNDIRNDYVSFHLTVNFAHCANSGSLDVYSSGAFLCGTSGHTTGPCKALTVILLRVPFLSKVSMFTKFSASMEVYKRYC